MIPFNKPYLTGDELFYINDVLSSHVLSGNGQYTKKCQLYFENRYGFRKCLLTTSGTDALEMCAMLCNIEPGDEVIVPSYTFVSTALAFLREKAKIVFADSGRDNPNITVDTIKPLISEKTKVIVVVHYAGVSCDMEPIMMLAEEKGIIVVEDAAQAIDSYYNNKPLGSIGHLAAFSFHETKNVICGEGGMLVINDERFIRRSEILWEKGTNRSEFFKGVVNKYGWCDMGSSFLPAEICSAFLYAQINKIDEIQSIRKTIWNRYYQGLQTVSNVIKLPYIPSYASNNAHIFYILCNNIDMRDDMILYMKNIGVQLTFHYVPLHSSSYYQPFYDGRELCNCDYFGNCLVRLPLFIELTDKQIDYIVDNIIEFVKSYNLVKR